MKKTMLCAAVATAVLVAGCGGSSGGSSSSLTPQLAAQVVAVNGISTMVFSGNRADYTLTATASGFDVVDTVGSGGTVAVTASRRLQFADVNVAFDTSGVAGKAYRIYRAAFDRTPDPGGLGYWIDVMDKGASLTAVATDVMKSQESKDLFGANPSNAQLVTGFYTNVLHRAPDAGGYNYWVGVLDNKQASVGNVLANISESPENVSQLAAQIANGIAYTPITRIAANSVPGAPTIGTATAGSGSASVAFAAPSATGGAAISGYTATCSGSGASFTATGSASPILVTGLSNGVVYTCSVKASNSVGSSAASGTVTVTPAAQVTVTVPGAPTITSATAANASAAIAFSAPSSTGGATITGYTASCSGGSVTRTATGSASPLTVTSLTNGTSYSCTVTATNSAGTGTASLATTVTPSATAGTITGAVLCPYSYSALNTTLNLMSTASITCSGTSRTITGNGIPDHAPGTFPNSGNPNAIAIASVNFTNTLNPAVVSSTGTAVAHTVGYAYNTVKFDPATAESYQNAGVWKIEALNQSYFPFGVDSSNAHVQPGGAYHYHGMPEGMLTGKGTKMILVGFAVDGFPIYARYGYTSASDATSAVKVMTSSYRLKTSASSGRPSTSTVPMGTFTQDYEYVAGLGDLDECNGRTGVTPEFPSGIYHYYITDSYPYIQRCVKGTAASTGP